MWRFHLLLLLALSASDILAWIRDLPDLSSTRYEMPGDLNLGIVVPVHRFHKTRFCGTDIRELGALQRLEAMAFAVSEVNNRSDILPNVTLGFIMLDDCTKATTALIRAMHFVQEVNATACGGSGITNNRSSSVDPLDVVGVIGSESSSSTVQMADLLSIFHVPLLSYISTSPVLSNKEDYSYFSRIVPSDILQGKVLVDIIDYFNFTYVSIVYEQGSYGSEGYKALAALLEDKGLCVAVVKEMRQSFSDSDYEGIIDSLKGTPRAKVVVLFASLAQVRGLLWAAKRTGMQGKFTWLGSDGWGRNIQDYRGVEEVALSAITVKFFSKTVTRFNDYFRRLSVARRPQNPWLPEFVEDLWNCSFNPTGNQALCSRDQTFEGLAELQPEATVSLVIDAIYTYAHALHNLTLTCPSKLRHDPKACLEAGDLLQAIRETTFEGESGRVAFNSLGNGNAVYEVQGLVRNGSGYSLVSMGLWDSDREDFIQFQPEVFEWNSAILGAGETLPVSRCSDPCAVGEQAVRTQPFCCWYCQPCRANERTDLVEGLPKCVACSADNFTWPDDATRTRCELIEGTYVSVRKLMGGLILAVDVVVMVMAVFALAFFIRNNKARLIKASSRELAYFILGAIFVSCVLVGVNLTRPSTPICVVTYLGFHLSFAATFGPLAVKTNRIYRIFNQGRRSRVRPKLIDSRSQLIFALALVLGQVCLATGWILADSPRADKSMPNPLVRFVEESCHMPQTGFLTSVVYNLSLTLVCTFYAVKTRSLPDNYNESKYISFCVYTTVVLWLAFIPTYFTIHQAEFRAMSLSLAMTVNNLVMLLFLYYPKIYALYYVDDNEQNIQPSVGPRGQAFSTRSNMAEGNTRVFPLSVTKTSSTFEAIKTPSIAPMKEISEEGDGSDTARTDRLGSHSQRLNTT